MDRTCEDQQAAYLEGDPTAADHLADCSVCVLEQPALDEIKGLLGDEAMWVEPPADLEDRVVAAALGDELSHRRARRDAPRARRGIGRPIWLAAAACVVGALLGAGVVKALDRPTHFQQQVALAGTLHAPQASAVAKVRANALGLEIRLDVTGLPTTPAGSFYEAWVKGPNGLVPIGTFHTGNGVIMLWSGVPLSTHPTFTVTIQKDDGNSTSSGIQVLVGTLK
jgi:hypothetical protein